jgi:hypothetical protein
MKKENFKERTEADLKEAVAPASSPGLPTSGRVKGIIGWKRKISKRGQRLTWRRQLLRPPLLVCQHLRRLKEGQEEKVLRKDRGWPGGGSSSPYSLGFPTSEKVKGIIGRKRKSQRKDRARWPEADSCPALLPWFAQIW